MSNLQTEAFNETKLEAIQEQISKYVEYIQSLQKPEGDINYYKVSVQFGKRYAKVIKDYHGSKSVHSFIDLTNGDILKSASWAKPAPHARGNIFKDYSKSVSEYGANYLR